MTNIYECRFLILFRENGSESVSPAEVEAAYREFRRLLVSVADSRESYSSVFRILSDVDAFLQILPTLYHRTRSKKKIGG